MMKTPTECRDELTQLGWRVYVGAFGDVWKVTALRAEETIVSQGEDRAAVWNAVLKQAQRKDYPGS